MSTLLGKCMNKDVDNPLASTLCTVDVSNLLTKKRIGAFGSLTSNITPPPPNPKENVKFFKFDALSVIWFVKNQAKILDSALICDQSHVSFFENKHPFNKILLLWLKKGHAKIAL